MQCLHRLRELARRLGADAGQTTVEYALVILGAAGIAGLLIAWAKGGAIRDLFDKVIDGIL
jgi:ABC-type sulfate transport system permease component